MERCVVRELPHASHAALHHMVVDTVAVTSDRGSVLLCSRDSQWFISNRQQSNLCLSAAWASCFAACIAANLIKHDRAVNVQIGVVPTDSYPALVCDLENPDAVQMLAAVKDVSPTKPMSMLVKDFACVNKYTLGWPASTEPGACHWVCAMIWEPHEPVL